MNLRKAALLMILTHLVQLPFSVAVPRPSYGSLSDQGIISVLTMGPGKEIYLAFGHSALRVKDPFSGLDLVFNYGTFSLEDPLFIPKFIRGELNYRLEVYPSAEEYLAWDIRHQNRIWIEQELALTGDQKQALYRFLIHNALPENRYYIYDFLKDNCSTRITDALRSVLGDDLVLTSPLSAPRTFRQLLDEYAGKRPFWQFLFALALGTASDRNVLSLEEDWLPFYLLYILDRGEVKGDGDFRPLVAGKRVLYNPEPPSDYSALWSDPGYLLWPLAFLVLVFSVRGFLRMPDTEGRSSGKNSALGRAGDAGLFLFVGVVGCILIYLDFFSLHTAVKGNWNLVWANPLAMGGFLAVFWKKKAPWLRGIFLPLTLGAGAVVVLWPWWPQSQPLSFLPLQFMIALRASFHFWRLSPKRS